MPICKKSFLSFLFFKKKIEYCEFTHLEQIKYEAFFFSPLKDRLIYKGKSKNKFSFCFYEKSQNNEANNKFVFCKNHLSVIWWHLT